MTIPSVKASTTNVNEGGDKISLARADIKQNIDNVNEIIDHLSASGNNTLLIPFGGLVVTEWSGTQDSANDGNKFYRMVTLGGAYYQRGYSATPSLEAADTIYGSIEGATVTRATPTLVQPSATTITAVNISVSLSNGTLTNSSVSAGYVSGRDPRPNPAFHSYGLGYDNYVTLPAGSYALSIHKPSGNPYLSSSLYASEVNLETDNDPVDGFSGVAEFWIYNKTDGTEITPAEGGANSIKNLGDMTNWGTAIQFFTLPDTKQIQFFNHSNVDAMGFDGTQGGDNIGISHDPTITSGGDPSGTQKTYFLSSGERLPGKLGWYVEFPNVYLRLEKIA
jgi:hypothetical protein